MTAGTSAPDGTIPIDLPGSLSVLTVPFIFTQDELLDTGTFIETVKARGFELSLADLQELHALGLLLPLFRVDDDPELALKMDWACPGFPDSTLHAQHCSERLGGDWEFREPKGGKARTVVIPRPLIPLLEEAKKAQEKERRAAGDRWEEWDLCFPNTIGRPMEPRDDWADLKWLCKSAGVRDARLHDARHTAATLLLEQGVDIRVVQDILGHSTLAVTKRYTRVTSRLARDAADRMARALWRTETTTETTRPD